MPSVDGGEGRDAPGAPRDAPRLDDAADAPALDAGAACAAGDYRLEGSPIPWSRGLPATEVWWEEDAPGEWRLARFAPDVESVVRSSPVAGVPFVAADATVFEPRVLAVSPSGEVLSALSVAGRDGLADPVLYFVLHDLDGGARSALAEVTFSAADVFMAGWSVLGAWSGAGWSVLVGIRVLGGPWDLLARLELDAAGALLRPAAIHRTTGDLSLFHHYDEGSWRGVVARAGTPYRIVDRAFELDATAAVVVSPLSAPFPIELRGAAGHGVVWVLPSLDTTGGIEHALRVDARTGLVEVLDPGPPLLDPAVLGVSAAVEDVSTLAIVTTTLRSDAIADYVFFDVYRVRTTGGIVQHLTLPRDPAVERTVATIGRVGDRTLVRYDGQLDELVACE